MKPMTEMETSPTAPPQKLRHQRRSCLCTTLIVITVIVLLLIAIALILFFTLFKPKDPETQLLSATVSGVSPRVSFPAVQLQLNLTIHAQISVYNPNRASFKHAQGDSQVIYRGVQVGVVVVSPGRIPSRGSETLNCTLVLEVESFGPELTKLIGDVIAGEIAVDVNTRVPGRVTFLGIFRRHAVAFSKCHVSIGVPDLKVRQQKCNNKTKL